MALDGLLCSLASRPPTATVANPYAGPLGETRLRNLQKYLTHVALLRPSVVLVGVAPGYRGCAVTGVPMTSRALLASDLGRWDLLAGLGCAAEETLGAPQNEITATTVWRAAVESLNHPPVTWNAFPFHPHPAGDPRSNRPLTSIDLREGQAWLAQLLALFPGVPVVAVGRVAARAMLGLGVGPLAVLRHPAHGGAAAFAAGLRAMARGLPASAA